MKKSNYNNMTIKDLKFNVIQKGIEKDFLLNNKNNAYNLNSVNILKCQSDLSKDPMKHKEHTIFISEKGIVYAVFSNGIKKEYL